MLILIAIFYGLLLTLLFIYGLNILYLSWIAWKQGGKPLILPPLEDEPWVTVQVPLYNERYVVERVIEAVCALDWQHLEIQILDDSTDQTVQLVANLVAHYQKQGVNINHLHRRHRVGYKAGALADGLKSAKGVYVAIFDADFVPTPDFLKRTLPFFADPQIGFIQTRWGHLNADYSPLTRVQAIGIDAHFMIEQFARHHCHYLMNFNGTGGIWRKTAIEAAGGWRADTLTEDLDLSYRAQLAGWSAYYLPDVVTPAEIPVTLNAYRRQQFRWARGSMECARLLIPRILRHPLPWMVKLQAVLHLTGYGIQVLMTLVALCYPFIIQLMAQHPEMSWLFSLTALFTLTFFAPTLYFILGQMKTQTKWQAQIPWILLLNLFGVGMMYQSAYAVLRGLFSRQPAEFERTPKFGITANGENWQAKTYHLDWNPILGFEILMLVYNLYTLRLALQAEHYSIAFYAALFALGGLFLLSLSVWQEFQMIPYFQPRRQTQTQIEG